MTISTVEFNRAEAERLAAERLLEEAKALIDDAKIRVDKDETEVKCANAITGVSN